MPKFIEPSYHNHPAIPLASWLVRKIFLFVAAFCLVGSPAMGAIGVLKEIEPKPGGELAKEVDDALAKGGRAVEMSASKQGSVSLCGSEPVADSLAGPVTVSTQVRGTGFVGLAEPMRMQATLTSKTSGLTYTDYGFIQGTRIKPDAYTAIPLKVLLPAKPDAYHLQVVAVVDEPATGPVVPTATFGQITVSGHTMGSAYISRVEPDKNAYRPGEEIKTVVTLVNPTSTAFKGKIDGKELMGIDRVANEASSEVELAANSFKEVTLTWKAGAEWAGRELRATLSDSAGAKIDSFSTTYGVAKDPSWLSTPALYGTEYKGTKSHHAFTYVDPASDAETARALNFYKERRVQRWEFFSWSYNEIAQFLPPANEEPYLGNEGMWWMSLKKFKQQVAGMKAMGCTPVTYINGHAWGPAAYDLFQKHPDWFIYTKNGELHAGGGYDMESRAHYERRGEFDYQQRKIPFFYANFNPLNPEARQHIADQIITVAKELGFEGARWDVWSMDVKPDMFDFSGKQLVTTGGEADRLSAESYRAIRELVAKEVPNFTWGANYGAPEENTGTPLFLAEKCRDGGWILDEILAGANEKTSPYHVWSAYADRIVSWGDQIRQKGGIYNPFGFNRAGGKFPVDKVFESVFKVVSGSRLQQGGEFVSNLSGKVGRLDLLPFRFSDYYLSNDLRLLPPDQTVVKVKAPETLWWKNMVFEKKSPQGKPQVVVHLVNSPVSREVEENPTSAVRDPVRNIEVSAGKIDGKEPTQAWLLTAEPVTPELEPEVQAVPLKIKKTASGATVTVPSVQFLKSVLFTYGDPS